MDYAFADKNFFGYLGNNKGSVFTENYYIINVGAITYKLIFLKPSAGKTFLSRGFGFRLTFMISDSPFGLAVK